MTSDTNALLRSPLERLHRAAGASFKIVNNGDVVSHFVSPESEIQQAKSLAIADLSVLPRTGYKSRQAPEWLQSQGVMIPSSPNQCVAQTDGSLVASLSWDEYLILSPITGKADLVTRLDSNWSLEDDRMCYQLLRAHSHGWLAISGEHASALMAKLCGVDCRAKAFAPNTVIQTSVARLNAIIIRPAEAKTDLFYLLADSASSDYLWMCFIDALQEWDGKPVGIDAIETLIGS